MSWVAVAIGGSAVIGAGAAIYGANQAADAQGDAADQNARLQQQAMNNQLRIFEPNRALGYGATSDLASLYGYTLPQYTPSAALISGSGGGSGFAGGTGVSGSNTYGPNMIRVYGRSGGKQRRYGAWIDPVSGRVQVLEGSDEQSQMLTNYLRTGQWTGGDAKKYGRIIKEIDQLRGSGWAYNPQTQADTQAASTLNPAAPGSAANPGTGSAGNLSRFFTSPDYTFRRDEGQRNIGNSFAARGGAASGNALRALTEFNSNLASGEFNNYTQRLLAMAGLGGAATSNSANAVQNATQGITQANTQAGDARASGIVSGVNGVTNALNTGLNNWMLYQGGYFNRPAGG